MNMRVTASIASAPKCLRLFSPQFAICRVHMHTPTHALSFSPFLHHSPFQTFLIAMASEFKPVPAYFCN